MKAIRGQARRGRTRRRGRESGLTLLELLVVMGLIGLILGAGLGVFASRSSVAPVAPSIARSALRAAQAAAQLDRAPVLVVWNDEDSSLAVRAPQTLATWHFEGSRVGRGDERRHWTQDAAEDLLGVLRGAERVEPAYIGGGLDLGANRREATWGTPIHENPAFDFVEGFALSLMLRPDGAFDGTIWRLGRLAGLEYRRDGSLEAWITPRAEGDLSGRKHGGRVEVVLPARTAPLGRWTAVEVLYDRTELRVVVDGFPAAIVPATEALPTLFRPLVLDGSGEGTLG
ncbi:MAG: type II secretion system protein, partial [Planctomycetota bacterium]